ncbi:HC-toxin efflux carrier TOXA [Apiospora marii]|uniref:HC-toxin efflux carrier TOXA n=1 Tax=Apiospora marii TaxID=335849 RepID=UPI0031320004
MYTKSRGQGPFQIKLDQVELTHVGQDEVLFRHIREAYRKTRGSLTRNPFVVPKAVEYVKFDLIRRYKSGECVGNYETNSIPSQKEVRGGEYAFFPCPPRIGPLPIQSHLFMHSLLNPGDHSGNLAVQQLPKKVGTKLACTSGHMNGHTASTPSSCGWGIYIVEGPNIALVVWLLGAGLLSVFLLTTVWAAVYKDVQAGMGIGQFGLALLALLLTTAVVKESNTLPTIG